MEAEIHALFRRHEDNFNRGLHGEAAPEDAGALFTPGAWPRPAGSAPWPRR